MAKSISTLSDLATAGKAKQLQYYTGEKTAQHIQNFISFTRNHEGGKHFPVHYGDLTERYSAGFGSPQRGVREADWCGRRAPGLMQQRTNGCTPASNARLAARFSNCPVRSVRMLRVD